jgi:hypothetical protein
MSKIKGEKVLVIFYENCSSKKRITRASTEARVRERRTGAGEGIARTNLPSQILQTMVNENAQLGLGSDLE